VRKIKFGRSSLIGRGQSNQKNMYLKKEKTGHKCSMGVRKGQGTVSREILTSTQAILHRTTSAALTSMTWSGCLSGHPRKSSPKKAWRLRKGSIQGLLGREDTVNVLYVEGEGKVVPGKKALVKGGRKRIQGGP